MTAENRESPSKDPVEARPVPDKAPWRTPRLVAHGTVTLKTLAVSGPVQPSA